MASLYSRLTRTPPTLHPTAAALQDDELDAAFADEQPLDDDDDDGSDELDQLVHTTPSTSSVTHHSTESPAYDFERDPTLPTSTMRSLRSRLMPGTFYSRKPTGVMGGGLQNDGVFANLSAKPDGIVRTNAQGQLEYVGGDDGTGGPKDELLPTYDSAVMDSSPPYWETTVTLPGGTYGVLGPDDVLVEGLPVGNLFGFAWNLLVSMSFQFVGFLLTYLLHTTHAAKNGSRAGLGITMIQYGLYLQTRAHELANMTPEDFIHGGPGWNSTTVVSDVMEDDTDPWGLFGSPPSRQDWDGSTHRPTENSTTLSPWNSGRPAMSPVMPTEEQLHMSSVANEWISYLLMVVGWFLLFGGVLNYWRAVRWARAVRGEAAAGGTTA